MLIRIVSVATLFFLMPAMASTTETTATKKENLKIKIDQAQELYHNLVEEYNTLSGEEYEEGDILEDIGTETPKTTSVSKDIQPPVINESRLLIPEQIKQLEERVTKLEQKTLPPQIPLMPDAKSSVSQYDSACALYQAGDFVKALPSFQSIIAANPQDPMAFRAHIHIGEIYLRQDIPSKAIVSFEEALKGLKDNSLIMDAKLGKIDAFFKLKDKKQACVLIQACKNESLTEAQKQRYKDLSNKGKCKA